MMALWWHCDGTHGTVTALAALRRHRDGIVMAGGGVIDAAHTLKSLQLPHTNRCSERKPSIFLIVGASALIAASSCRDPVGERPRQSFRWTSIILPEGLHEFRHHF